MAGDTRIKLIMTAERLFAERGVYGVSLREIGTEAGQRNTGAVRYHFGTKERLVNAVFEHRMTPINEHRLDLLSVIDAAGGGYGMPGLIEAFLYPLAEALGEVGRPSWYLRFCVQAAYVEGSAPTDLAAQAWTRGASIVSRRAQELLAEAGLSPEMVIDRWNLTTGHLTHALADRELLLQHAPQRITTPRSAFLAHLIDTAVALAQAPVSHEAAHQLNDRRSA